MRQNIILIGYMGVGKSTIGKELAKRLGYSFKDTDKLIEQQTGKSISTIFEEDGEEAFRTLEANVINELCATARRTVISTGGGAVDNPETLELIKKSGFTVWLKADINTLTERLMRTSHRPMLENFGDKRERIQSLYESRADKYAQAHFSVDTVDRSAYATVTEIIDIYRTFLK